MNEAKKMDGAGGPAEKAAAASADREMPAAARRALAEAEERRRRGQLDPQLPREINGRKGPEPVRYGDWEKNGIACDF